MKSFYGADILDYQKPTSAPVTEPVDDIRYLINTNVPERDWNRPSGPYVDTSAFEAAL